MSPGVPDYGKGPRIGRLECSNWALRNRPCLLEGVDTRRRYRNVYELYMQRLECC